MQILKNMQVSLVGAVVLGSLLSAGVASAQQVVVVQPGYAPPPQYGQPVGVVQGSDGVRFRGGIALEGGALLPNGVSLGAIGPQGQIGVQINHLVGVYAVPAFDILFGPAGGVDFTFAVMADFTILNDQLTVGAGLDSGVYAALGSSGTSAAGAAGAQYGARLHAAWNAYLVRGENGIRRKALVVGLDLRFLVGPEAAASTNGNGGVTGSGSADGLVFSPMVTVGYQAF